MSIRRKTALLGISMVASLTRHTSRLVGNLFIITAVFLSTLTVPMNKFTNVIYFITSGGRIHTFGGEGFVFFLIS